MLLIFAGIFLALPEAASAQIWVSSEFTVAPDGNHEIATCATSAAEPNNPVQPPSAAATDYSTFLASCTVTPSTGTAITSAQCPGGSNGSVLKFPYGNPTGQCAITFQPQPNVTYTLNSTHALEFNLDPFGTACGQYGSAACFSDPLGYYAYPWPATPSYPSDTASIAVDETCSARGGACAAQNIPSEEEISPGVFIDAPEYWYLAHTSAAYSCALPAQETTAFDGWDAADSEPSVGMWKQTVSDPGGDNFFGFAVQETDAGGGVDACWFPNQDGVIPTTTVTGGEWMVQDGNTWGEDYVGSLPKTVAYYRAQNRVPCEITVHQQMQMRCSDDAWHNYGPVNTLQSIITATTVTSVRAGGTATRRY
ncbi:MAG: hypothetical protein ABR912_09345 [Terracidiphilus sp.]